MRLLKYLVSVGSHGPLARYVKLRVAHAPGMPGTFSPPPGVSDPDMHRGTCVTHVPWCMTGSLTSGFPLSRWRGKRSRHSRRMRNPQFHVSVKSPTEVVVESVVVWWSVVRTTCLRWCGVRLRFSIECPWLGKIWCNTYSWLRTTSLLLAHSSVILTNASPNNP